MTTVVDNADVLVGGGGPAGVAAAIASARAGARTCVIEAQGCLGGTWTSGCLAWILDHANKTGVMREILARLEALGGRAVWEGKPTNAFDVETMKLLLETMCGEAGVVLRLHHLLVSAQTLNGRLTHAVLESKSGRQAIRSKVFIDSTGDGDLAARAGCGFDLGREDSGQTQPMSLLALVAGIDREEIKPFLPYADGGPSREPKTGLKEEMERGGSVPSYGMPSLFWIRDDLFLLMANHEYGCMGINAQDLTDATIRARAEVHRLASGLRGLGGIWRRLHVVATGSHIGVREGRRVRGRYVVTAEDMVNGGRHADAVCRVTFGIDVHSTDKTQGTAIETSGLRTQPYDIPLRALIARDVDGLMMAGRCISGDFLAHSSYRVTGNAVAMGEAAGKVAARAALTGRLPQEVGWEEVQGHREPSDASEASAHA